MFYQDLAHRPSGKSEQVSAVPEPEGVVSVQPKVGLVHQRGGLQRMITALAAQMTFGQAVELPLDEREEIAGGVVVALV